jgi:hypothetical protein
MPWEGVVISCFIFRRGGCLPTAAFDTEVYHPQHMLGSPRTPRMPRMLWPARPELPSLLHRRSLPPSPSHRARRRGPRCLGRWRAPPSTSRRKRAVPAGGSRKRTPAAAVGAAASTSGHALRPHCDVNDVWGRPPIATPLFLPPLKVGRKFTQGAPPWCCWAAWWAPTA